MPNDPMVTAYATDELMRFLVSGRTIRIAADAHRVRDRL
jgi:hypothetical protein